MGSFVHQAALFGCDTDFLATAIPFVADGLDRGEPVLVTTTLANLALPGSALGARAGDQAAARG